MTNLVIVESPAKATTIKGYLGPSYRVVASKGHVRDLPKSTLGIDIENHFSPHYINIRGKRKMLTEYFWQLTLTGRAKPYPGICPLRLESPLIM